MTERIKCLVTIVDRGEGETAAELFETAGAPLHFACLGRGTANSDMLDYLGLGQTEKDVVLTLTTRSSAGPLLAMAARKLQLATPGRGIIFTLDLSAVSGILARALSREAAVKPAGKEEAPMERSRFDLIVAAVNYGGTDDVMEAARSAGARGGTILHARQLMGEALEKAGGAGVHPEKEIVTILTPRAQRQAIMEAVSLAAGITTKHQGILFSMPVEDLAGLSQGRPIKAE